MELGCFRFFIYKDMFEGLKNGDDEAGIFYYSTIWAACAEWLD
jgi:hypothetical protein